jgi:hypothetical protein
MNNGEIISVCLPVLFMFVVSNMIWIKFGAEYVYESI